MSVGGGRKRLYSLLLSHLFLLPLLLVSSGCRPLIALGKNPSMAEQQKFRSLPNYTNGEFQNLDPSPSPAFSAQPSRGPRWLRLFKYFAGKPKLTRPDGKMPAVITDLTAATSKPTVVWFGHSSFLLKTTKGNLLFDPVFNKYAGPLAGLVPAFRGTLDYGVQDMPVLDALIISHDHYDHLDYETVQKLRKKVARVIVPLGVGSHLRRWGYGASQITELNWGESVVLANGVKVTATPAHHRSNRGFEQRKTLWASYVIEADGQKLYFSGDTGYSRHFKLIGERYGPFDLAMLECGQYNKRWSQSHMHPTQTARAAADLQTKMVLPVHWAKFAESDHPWNEPVKLLLASADSLKVSVTVPLMGQPVGVGDEAQRVEWWNF